MNDSKIMELANKFIGDEDNLNRNEIIEILNSKKEKWSIIIKETSNLI